MFHISNAFLQFAWVRPDDCDVTMEISETSDKSASRMIVETPVGTTFCSARRDLQSQLGARGFPLSTQSGELSSPVAVEVTGTCFPGFPPSTWHQSGGHCSGDSPGCGEARSVALKLCWRLGLCESLCFIGTSNNNRRFPAGQQLCRTGTSALLGLSASRKTGSQTLAPAHNVGRSCAGDLG